MRVIDPDSGIRGLQVMVPMRDGVRLNTFVYLPRGDGPAYPVILQRTPYGIATENVLDKTDPAEGWLPDPKKPMWGALLRGWKALAGRGYAAVLQDCRGRHASEGIDRVYADDAADGFDTLEWISQQPWCNGRIGMSGSSAAATTTLAAASQRHPALMCFFAQVGGASIYDDVVYEGNGIEMERLWLWVAANIPGLSRSHREMVKARFGLDEKGLAAVIERARALAVRLEAAKSVDPPFVTSADWLHLPLLGAPDFSVIQPFLDEILSHPAPDEFRAAHDFAATIDVPGFHATTWYDIFQTSVIGAFQRIEARVGNQRLWIGPNAHYFIYESQFWPRDPYFEWFDHWLKGRATPLVSEPAVHYSPRTWVEPEAYVADDWRHAASWPPPDVRHERLHLTPDGRLVPQPTGLPPGGQGAAMRTFTSDPRRPVPTRGGRNMLIEAGPQDQRPLYARADYGLVYSGAELCADLRLAGPVVVTLTVSSDRPDTDIVAKLVEVHDDGRAMLLMDGVVRLLYRGGGSRPQSMQPGVPVEVTIPLGDICHTVKAGHRLQLDITGSNFPRRARNTNSGHARLAADTEADIRVATNTLHHGNGDVGLLMLTVPT